MTPVLLLSLPRSGSTLLQRMVSSHPLVASTPEAWVNLPLAYMTRDLGQLSEYNQWVASTAINTFVQRLPGGMADWYRLSGEFVRRLYRQVSPDSAIYFLDKTPRYYFIVEYLRASQPEAKFVFLFRNPLQVLASVIDTWGDGRLNHLFRQWTDLTTGFRLLSHAARDLADAAVRIRFDELVTDPEGAVRRVCAYLHIEYDQTIMDRLDDDVLDSRIGDIVGAARYQRVSSEPLARWRATLRSPVRRFVARRMLKSIPDWALNVQGYERDELRQELASVRGGWLRVPVDFVDAIVAWSVYSLKLNLVFSNRIRRWLRRRMVG